MKKRVLFSLLMISIVVFLFACSKGNQNNRETTRNGVNISIASAVFNSYRTTGFQTLPVVPALAWNDTLSDAAFQFAKDIATQGDGFSIYMTGRGGFILDYPTNLGYQENATLAFCYLYPASANLKNMIDLVFNQYPNYSSFTNGIMDVGIKQFGMAFFNNRWYLIAAAY